MCPSTPPRATVFEKCNMEIGSGFMSVWMMVEFLLLLQRDFADGFYSDGDVLRRASGDVGQIALHHHAHQSAEIHFWCPTQFLAGKSRVSA